jgi:G3E family GTPase
MDRVKVNVIGGFLGSGKTTLLRRFLSQPKLTEKVAVLVNELGEVGIDGKVLERPGLKMMELTNGCICCQVTGDMIQAVKDIRAQYQPERLLIETTGVAEPGKVLMLLYSPYLDKEVWVEPTIVVVDAAAFDRLFAELAYHYVMQIKPADVVVLSKTDLAPVAVTARVEKRIRELNPRALIVKAVKGEVDLLKVLEGVEGGKPEESSAAHVHEEKFDSFIHEGPEVFDKQKLGKFLEGLPKGCYRSKGFVKTPSGWFLVNFTTGQTEWESWPSSEAPAQSRLVFIGKKLDKKTILQDLKKCVKGR